MEDKLFLILLDKGVLAIVLLSIGFLFNSILQKNRLRGEVLTQLASKRADAFESLWKGIAKIRPKDSENVTPDKKKEITELLKKWYHDESGALYMSWHTAKRYMLLRRSLTDEKATSDEVKKQISLLRTRLKIDCGIYSYYEGFKQLPSPRNKRANN